MTTNNTYYTAVATAVLKEARDTKDEHGDIAQAIQDITATLALEYKAQNPAFHEMNFRAEVLKRIAQELQDEISRRASKGEHDVE